MSAHNMLINAGDSDRTWLYRVGGGAAIGFGIAYLIIIALYIPMGARPSGAEALLAYIGGNALAWWAILGLSVLTDFLLVPIGLALYFALKSINAPAMLIATAFVGLFVILDLALTWTNFAVLISLSGPYASAADDAQRAVFATAALYPSSVVGSNLLFVYNSLTLAVGILITGLVLLRSVFGKRSASVGVATGVLGIAAVASSFFSSSVSGMAIILTSVLTLVWYLMVGYKLYRLA